MYESVDHLIGQFVFAPAITTKLCEFVGIETTDSDLGYTVLLKDETGEVHHVRIGWLNPSGILLPINEHSIKLFEKTFPSYENV